MLPEDILGVSSIHQFFCTVSLSELGPFFPSLGRLGDGVWHHPTSRLRLISAFGLEAETIGITYLWNWSSNSLKTVSLSGSVSLSVRLVV